MMVSVIELELVALPLPGAESASDDDNDDDDDDELNEAAGWLAIEDDKDVVVCVGAGVVAVVVEGSSSLDSSPVSSSISSVSSGRLASVSLVKSDCWLESAAVS